MAETRGEEGECALPAKRKPDLTSSNADEHPSPKAIKTGDMINGDSHADGGSKGVQVEDNGAAKTEVADASGGSGVDPGADEGEEVEDDGFDEDDEEEDEDYDDDDDDEHEDVEEDRGHVLDVKGKGILKDDKGKGKLIVDEDDDDSDSDETDDTDPSGSDGGVQSGSDGDWSDDPLAEVDLDNILPSRTRRRRPQSGVVIANNKRNTDGSTGGNNA